MGQLRLIHTDEGDISYTLTRKRVKNWNLRVREGQVLLSAPLGVSQRQADAFVRSRAVWIVRTVTRQTQEERTVLELLPREECAIILSEAVERVLPLVARFGVERPQLRVRMMRSQWGNCHWTQGYITLNAALASCPQPLQDYVVLHELVHFLHHDHAEGFYAVMDELMPDWKHRRRELKKHKI